MTIEKEYGAYYLTCDNCGTSMDQVFVSFDDALDAKHKCGWKSVNNHGKWENWCNECLKVGGTE